MKILSCTVLYNPKVNMCNNIISYAKLVDKVMLIDNSESKNNDFYTKLDENNIKYELVYYGKNMGIARALKDGCKYAINNDYNWCLTMDQDSLVNVNKDEFDNIKRILNDYNEYGIISFDYNNSLKSNNEISNVKMWITSGNFINISNYKKIEGFNEDLFIDYVDFDLCRQFNDKKVLIGVMNYSIKHEIGNPIRKKILFKKFNCMNHNPVRYYYRYRNSRYLYKNNKKFYLKVYLHEMIVDFFKMLLYEEHKFDKIKMIKRGLKDAKKDKLGIYREE